MVATAPQPPSPDVGGGAAAFHHRGGPFYVWNGGFELERPIYYFVKISNAGLMRAASGTGGGGPG
jgi:hypothetical protein